jgi:SAM-dependent methyltransferase
MEIKKPTDVIDFYNQYAKRQKVVGINGRHKSILNKAINLGLQSTDQVLEVGCGIGTFTSLLAHYLKDGMLYSSDISDENIKIAKQNLGHLKNLNLQIQDATDFIMDMEFDAIIMPDVIEHIPIAYHARMFQNMAKMLKQTGFIYIHIPNPYYLEWLHLYRKDLLQVIDQPIYLDEFIQNIAGSGLYVFQENAYMLEGQYAIWSGDYTHRVLRKWPILKEETFVPTPIKKDIWSKVKRKMKNILKKIIYYMLYVVEGKKLTC